MSKYNIPDEREIVNDLKTMNEEDKEVDRLVDQVEQLWKEHSRIDVQIKFQIGDRVRRMNAINAGICRGALTSRFGKGLYRQFKQCGWIAYRWRELNSRQSAIDEGKAWTFFRDNDPLAGVVYPKNKPTTFFLGREFSHSEGDAYYAKCIGGQDREITVRFPEGMVEEIILKDGWVKK